MTEVNVEAEIKKRIEEIENLKSQESEMLATLSEEELAMYLENVYRNNKKESKEAEFKIVVGGKKDEC